MIPGIPVYQMTYGQGSDGRAGLVFTTEQEEYTNQSVLFVIPIIDAFERPPHFIDFLQDATVVFPFLLGNKYYDLEGKVNFPEVIFNIPEVKRTITFEIDIDNIFGWHFYPFWRREYRKIKYVGEHVNLVPRNNGFIILQPVDLYEMDELYIEHKGVFVGFTPNFGIGENYNRQ